MKQSTMRNKENGPDIFFPITIGDIETDTYSDFLESLVLLRNFVREVAHNNDPIISDIRYSVDQLIFKNEGGKVESLKSYLSVFENFAISAALTSDRAGSACFFI